ncbi:mannose-6-phosphate isomerase, class I [Microbacterium trichothecenolyticum]|uniref:mannose-6-phosphate isomerase n=1 Tax=Microbacterium trichothecenolyticum TaxID=69370 RepID=A0A0M2H9F9_MICTR|nr:mannose-6-phosphate isomerase, class I [Microbacterium trichothecenolyticum]KJL41251.1 Mannose-6-phosphate isomerase [Microbacterium trichothecenolyticum]
MLIPLANDPRDYAWGSTSLLADLEGREASGRPEAEVWFGDHPGDPSETADGRTLDRWIADEGAASGVGEPLPYLLKLLAAASALSIQAHPSKAQAEEGFAREEAAGIPRDAPDRTYRDANHKPELIVALSDTFRALAGLRDLDATRRLVATLGPGAAPLADRLKGADASLSAVIGWLLSDGAAAARDVIAAAVTAESDEFAAELALARTLEAAFPGDPGIVVALLMNLVTLQRGEGLFVPAGVLHAYLEGLGVELMAASDNVLRGGLTPKHVDAAELVSVLDPTPGLPPVIVPREIAAGVRRYDVPVADFALLAVSPDEDGVEVVLEGPAIAVATAGSPAVRALASEDVATLSPGAAVLVTANEGGLRVTGEGEIFVALPGH